MEETSARKHPRLPYLLMRNFSQLVTQSVTIALVASGCTGYLGGSYEQTLFLGGRLVDANGDPLNHCQAGAEQDGEVREWQAVDSEMRAIFLLTILANEHRIVIQCRGYIERVILAIPDPSGGWVVDGTPVRLNESAELGELVFAIAFDR